MRQHDTTMSDQEVRRQLLALLGGGNAHMGLRQAVADYPLEAINKRPPHVEYTPWHLLEHIRLSQWDILDFIRNPDYQEIAWPEGYWPRPEEQADAGRWQATIEAIAADTQALAAIVAEPATDLYADLPHAAGYTILREILVVADHNAYHIGEFAILRQVMGTWPAGHG